MPFLCTSSYPGPKVWHGLCTRRRHRGIYWGLEIWREKKAMSVWLRDWMYCCRTSRTPLVSFCLVVVNRTYRAQHTLINILAYWFGTQEACTKVIELKSFFLFSLLGVWQRSGIQTTPRGGGSLLRWLPRMSVDVSSARSIRWTSHWDMEHASLENITLRYTLIWRYWSR